jgi:4-hydroxybenzoyl-CoA thioesterase
VTSHETTVQVRWGDVDAAGIVFYPRFYEWYDLGCEALFAALGLPWPELFPRHGIVGVPIVESGARFTSPARYGDTLTVRATVAWVKEKTFRMEYEIAAGDRRCASGFEVRAWVRRPAAPGARLQAGPIPDDVARRLRGDAGPAAGVLDAPGALC